MVEEIVGKRGSGKTFKAFERLKALALEKPNSRLVFVAQQNRVPTLMKDTLDEHGIDMSRVRSVSRTMNRIDFDNDSTIRFTGERGIEMLRGLRFEGIVADATENFENRDKALTALSICLQPDAPLIETRWDNT